MSDVSVQEGPLEKPGIGDESFAIGGLDSKLLLFFPGVTQILQGDRERGYGLLGTFWSAFFVGFCAWGTWLGVVLLVFAFFAHLFATADAMTRAGFPRWEAWVPWLAASVGLGLGCYGPLTAISLLAAWPAMREDRPREGYLIDRWTLHWRGPARDEHVWVDSEDGAGPWLGRVVALPGEQVESLDRTLRIDGRIAADLRKRFADHVGEIRFRVPEDHLLLIAADDSSSVLREKPTPKLVRSSRIIGIAWAKYYPIWERRLL